MKIWVDIKNSHEPLFFKSIESNLLKHQFHYSFRDYAEIKKLMKKYDMEGTQIGFRPEGDIFKRKIMFLFRVLNLVLRAPKGEVSLTHYSGWAIWASKILRRPVICISDNDINPDSHHFFPYIDKFLVFVRNFFLSQFTL